MAYAAVISLLQTLKSLSERPPITRLHKVQIGSLYHDVYYLQVFLEDMAKECHDQWMVKGRSLETRIRNFAYLAEDTLELHVCSSFYLPEPRQEQEKALFSIHKSFQHIIEKVASIKAEVRTTYDQISGVRILQKPESSSAKDLSRKALVPGGTVMGCEKDIERILDQLTSLSTKLDIIPIVGMGGIGKTTLAKRVYDDPLVMYHFYVRAWITVSEQYRAREMLLGILSCVALHSDARFDENETKDEKLLELIYRRLKGRRYLIVMDDIWSTQAWDDIRRSFPDDNNGSRVIITTRQTGIGVYVRPNRPPHQVSLLSIDDSWKLLREKVFQKKSCPPRLVNVGKRIAEQCKGLPLAILVVAGFLSKREKTVDFWFNVAERVTSIVTKNRNQCLGILGLSYNYLPQHLKACFLYLGVFPEDSEIPVWKLIRLWIAEGFLLPVTHKSLEDVAEEYLDDLIDRNLVMVRRTSSDGKIKTCSIHDLLRDLSLREAQKEGFLHSVKNFIPISLAVAQTSRRLSFQSDHSISRLSIPFSRSFFIWGSQYYYTSILPYFFNHTEFKLLRVLDITFTHFNHFPMEIIQLIHLRYLALTTLSNLPPSISKLLNLEILILYDKFKFSTFPKQIWELPKLRHIHSKAGCHLPDPSKAESEDEIPVVLQSLQTISRLSLSSCKENVLTSIPNLKKLGIIGTKHDYHSTAELSVSFSNLPYLQQLEKLKIHFNSDNQNPQWIPSLDAFPKRLKKLTLAWTYLPWDYMSILGMLPNLEVLKLRYYAFKGEEWEPTEEGFCNLKVLQLHHLDLVQWSANKFHFPSLQKLVLRFCFYLKELPHGIGDIDTLEIIDLDDFSPSAVISAKQIQEQQKSQGNDELEVHIYHAMKM